MDGKTAQLLIEEQGPGSRSSCGPFMLLHWCEEAIEPLSRLPEDSPALENPQVPESLHRGSYSPRCWSLVQGVRAGERRGGWSSADPGNPWLLEHPPGVTGSRAQPRAALQVL